MIFSKARSKYKCSTCKGEIIPGDLYLNKPKFKYGADKYCISCVRSEIPHNESEN